MNHHERQKFDVDRIRHLLDLGAEAEAKGSNGAGGSV